jgi:glutaryl-CoA dehydrogenase
VVERGAVGLRTEKIKNKLSTRMIENAVIHLDKVYVPPMNKLAKATNFATGANKILEKSRLIVGWSTVGIAAGAYESALNYVLNRK